MGLFDGSDGGGFMGLLANPQTAGLLGMAGGLLQASGPSRIPVSMGQAMGAGFQGMGQGAAGALNTQRQLMQMQAMQGLNGLLGANSGPSSAGVAPAIAQQPAVYGAANVGPVSGVSAGMGGYAPAPSSAASSAAAAYPDQAGGPVLFGGKTPAQIRQIGMAASMAGFPAGAELLKMGAQYDPALAMQMPTDAQRMAAAAYGYGTPQYEAALQSQVQKAGYMAPIALRTPIYYDPATGTTKVVPPDQLAQGYGAMYGAQELAKAQNQNQQVWDPNYIDPATGQKGRYVYQTRAQVNSAAAGNNPSAPAPLRNNNPGALMPGGQLAQYPDMQTGLAALDNNLQAYGKQGVNTLAGVISKWAPPNENNTQAYIQDVSQRLGVKPDQPIDLSNPAVRQAISTGIMLHENGPGAVFSAPSAAARPMAAQAPLGATSNANTAQAASAKVMADDYENMQQVRQNAPAVLQAYDHLLGLAETGGWQGWAANGGLTGKLMSTDAATYASPAAAEYDKTRAYLVNAGGSAMGEHNTDAARANLDRMIPEFGKPTQAKIDGIQQARNQTAMTALRANLLAPIFQAGDSKTYTDLANQFDNSVKPEMVPALTQLMQIKDPATANAAIQQAAKKYGPIGNAARLLQQHGLIVGGQR